MRMWDLLTMEWDVDLQSIFNSFKEQLFLTSRLFESDNRTDFENISSISGASGVFGSAKNQYKKSLEIF